MIATEGNPAPLRSLRTSLSLRRLLLRLLPNEHAVAPGFVPTFVRWSLLGLVLRLAIMPFTWSDDAALLHAFASLLPEQGVLFVHTYMREHYGPMLDAQRWSYYPLGTYFTFGLWQLLTRPLAPGFVEWMVAVREAMGQGGGYLPQYVWMAGDLPLFRALFFAKLPYLVADFGIALLLPRLIGRSPDALLAHRLWMLNPVTLYATYLYGQFEIIEALFIVASLVLARQGRARWAVILLGIAATYKHIPLLLVPPTALLLGASWRQRLALLILGASPYFVLRAVSGLLAPGVEGAMGNPALLNHFLQPSDSRLALALRLALPLGYGALLAFLASSRRRLQNPDRALVPSWTIALLLLLVGLPLIQVYWYVLLAPLLVLEFASHRRAWVLFAAHFATLVPWNSTPGMLWGTLLAPLDPLFFPALPTPEALVSQLVHPGHVARASWYLYVALTIALVGWLALRLRRPRWQPPLWPSIFTQRRSLAAGAVALVAATAIAASRIAPSQPLDQEPVVHGLWQYEPPKTFVDPSGGYRAGQSFVSVLPNLSRIDLYLRPSAPAPGPELRLRLFAETPDGEGIAEANLTAFNGGVGRFDFGPLADSAGRRFYFDVTTVMADHQPPAVGWTPDRYAHQPTGGQRFEDGVPAEGDLAFLSFHAAASLGAAAANVQRRLATDLPFTLPYLALLAGATCVWLRLAVSPARARPEPPM